MSDLQVRERRFVLWAFLFIGLFLSPYFILGEDAHIRVHDNLDSNIAWYKVLAHSGQLTGSVHAEIPQIINGLPRNALGTEYSFIVWLYVWFEPMTAYGISQAMTRLFAFIGMYLLLKHHFVTEDDQGMIRAGTALAFALTPFWPSGMLSTLGMPLALWAFLNIRQGIKLKPSFLVLTLLPFYSSIVLGFFFFLSAMGLFWLSDVVRGKGWNWRFFISILYMTLVYLAADYRLVYSFLFDDVPNSRDDYFHARLSFGHSLMLTVKNYLLGHHHVATLHTLVIQPVMILAFLLLFKRSTLKWTNRFVFLFILNFLLSAWYAFWFFKGWLPATERLHFLDTFNFARYHFLRPMVIYLLFAMSLALLWKKGQTWRRTVPFLLSVQIILLTLANEELLFSNKPSFKEFYAEEQFSEIKQYIGKPLAEYRVASIGLHPAIAQYNGFYTLDTYNNFYPLTYKEKFREIIASELEKSKTIRVYFDEWGGRCYLFSAELGKHYQFKKTSKKRIKNLELNLLPFKQMGGDYILSSVPIDNAAKNGMELEKIFNSRTSAWRIFLYKVV